jgi:hypothetical protein
LSNCGATDKETDLKSFPAPGFTLDVQTAFRRKIRGVWEISRVNDHRMLGERSAALGVSFALGNMSFVNGGAE